MSNRPHENDDLWEALECNTDYWEERNGESIPPNFTADDIVDILHEVCGHNDELCWWWVLKLKANRVALLSGWCDYTGWNCQSGLTLLYIGYSVQDAILTAPLVEGEQMDNVGFMRGDDSDRTIRAVLLGQYRGSIPFGLYEHINPDE